MLVEHVICYDPYKSMCTLLCHKEQQALVQNTEGEVKQKG